MILETERLVLTPLVADDAVRIYPFLSDPELMAHLDRAPLEDPDEVAACVAAQVEEMTTGAALYWAVRLADTQAFVGACEFVEIDERRHRAELRFVVARDCWGRGYAHEALTALLAHAAADGLKYIVARTQVGDARAEKLLERLGFKNAAYLKGQVDRDGERRDGRLFGLEL